MDQHCRAGFNNQGVSVNSLCQRALWHKQRPRSCKKWVKSGQCSMTAEIAVLVKCTLENLFMSIQDHHPCGDPGYFFFIYLFRTNIAMFTLDMFTFDDPGLALSCWPWKIWTYWSILYFHIPSLSVTIAMMVLHQTFQKCNWYSCQVMKQCIKSKSRFLISTWWLATLADFISYN